MRGLKGPFVLFVGLLFCCLFMMGATAGDVEVAEGVYHGTDESMLIPRGVYHTQYPEFTNFRIEEDGKTVAPGDTIHFRVKAIVADTNVEYAYLYIGWNRNHEQYVSLRLDEATGEYVGEYTFSETQRSGEYYITSAYIYDRYGFHTSYYSSSKRVMKRLFPGSVILRNSSYAEPIRNVIMVENGKTLKPGDKLHFSFEFLKEMDIYNVQLNLYPRYGGDGMYLRYYTDESEWTPSSGSWNYDKNTGVVTCEYTLTDTDYNGTYDFNHIFIRANGSMYRADTYDSNDYRFTLTGAMDAVSDDTSRYIRLESVSFAKDGKTVVDGDKLEFAYQIATNGEDVNTYVELKYFDPDDYNSGSGINSYIYHSISVDAEPVAGKNGQYKASYTMQEADLYGVYAVNVYVEAHFETQTSSDAAETSSSRTFNTDFMFRFDQKADAKLNRLAPVTNLNWTEDGYIRCILPDDHQGRMSVKLHSANQDTNNWIRWYTYDQWTITTGSGEFVSDVLRVDTDLISGRYYVSVTMQGDGVNYFDSPVVKSPMFTYTQPDEKLPVPTVPAWNVAEKELRMNFPAVDMEKCWLECQWYFAEKLEDMPESCRWYSGGWWYDDDSFVRFTPPDNMLQEYGAGYYYARIRLCSNNVLEYQSGDWSELSDGCYFSADGNEEGKSVIDQLEDVVVEDKTADEIRAQVQQISTTDLKVALMTDEETMDALRSLEVAAGAATEIVVESGAPDIVEGLTTVGAGLNNITGEAPKLVIDKPKQNDVIPAQYDNAVAVRFSMELENVEDPDNLKVPVIIDMPIPSGVVPAYAVILHYHLTTNQPTLIHPYVYQAGNKWYAQFVLTSFSDFIITHDLADMEGDAMVISAGTINIEDEAFRGTGCEIVMIPEGCKAIGSKAFADCRNLSYVWIPDSVTEIAEDAFEGSGNYAIITSNPILRDMDAFADRIVNP